MSHQKPPVMSYRDLPQQRLYQVTGLPDFSGLPLPTQSESGSGGIPRAMPESAQFICQAEWAWSPMHNRIENYYLSSSQADSRWILWVSYFDDSELPWHWETYEDVYVIDQAGIPEVVASIWLLKRYWELARDDEYIDEFHWIGSEGLLEISDLKAIARIVWQESSEE